MSGWLVLVLAVVATVLLTLGTVAVLRIINRRLG